MTKEIKATILLDELLEVYEHLIIPFMKIQRDIPFPTEPQRAETDGEHSYTLAMLAVTLSERMNKGLDTGLIVKYALIHDLVEVHAGDTSAKADDAQHQTKVDREHEAYLLIKEKYLDKAPWIAAHIETYEKREDEESKFVYALDKSMGALNWLVSKGAGWPAYYPDEDGRTYHKVVERLRNKAKLYPHLLELFDLAHDKLDTERTGYYGEIHDGSK